MKKIITRILAGFVSLNYAPILLAEGSGWFPQVPASDNMMGNGKTAMTVTGNYVKQGMSLILFIVAVGMFIKFIATVSHGIEEAKKSEGGSLAVFGTFTVMAIIYLAISIATGYLGYNIITKFQI